MIVSIGLFVLKQRNLLPEFLAISKEIHQQALDSNGNLKAELDNEGIASFYSFTHWDNKENMLAFVHSKKHVAILKDTERLCKKAQFLHYEANNFVDIETAKQELDTHPKVRTLEFV